MHSLSIIIPAFNEQQFITEVISQALSANSLNLSQELIVIDDGSTDHTSSILHRLKSSDIKLITLSPNRGKTYAVKEGIASSTGDIVLIQDADLEYHPENYPSLLKPFLYHDADVVYGSRFRGPGPSRMLYFTHYLANHGLTLFSNLLTNLNLSDVETGYKAFRGDLIRQLAPRLTSSRFGFETEITARLSKIKDLKIFEVGISYYGRAYSEGKKIKWYDALQSAWIIFKHNLF